LCLLLLQAHYNTFVIAGFFKGTSERLRQKRAGKIFLQDTRNHLKKQGMLALTFANKEDYNKTQEDDTIDITGLTSFEAGGAP